MINPRDITRYDRSDDDLVEFWLFCFCVAGKPAMRIAPLLQKMLDAAPGDTIRDKAIWIGTPENTRPFLERFGCAPYKDRVPAFQETARRLSADPAWLRMASADDLLMKGVSLKTSRFFVLHSRRHARVAALDTHILAFLSELGIPNVPKLSPSSRKVYVALEQKVLMICDVAGCAPADLDLTIWKSRTRRDLAAEEKIAAHIASAGKADRPA